MRIVTSMTALIILLGLPTAANEPSPVATEDNEWTMPIVTVVVHHRVVTSFADTIEVACGTGEQYWIGDTDYSLEALRFVPDFGINQKGEIIERSTEAHNPACEIVIYNEGVEVDRIWSFFGTGAPHFRRQSILSVDMISVIWREAELTAPVPRKDD